KAVASPLLDETSIEGARGILINFTGGADLSIHEVEEAARIVQEAAHEEAHIIFGAVIDPQLSDEVRMTVIATGFAEKKEAVGVGGKVVDLPRASRSVPAAPSTQWRRRFADSRAEAEGEIGAGDLEVPAFLRRPADEGGGGAGGAGGGRGRSPTPLASARRGAAGLHLGAARPRSLGGNGSLDPARHPPRPLPRGP